MSGLTLVTGASGFIGRRLVPALADAGMDVRAATRQPALARFGPGVTPVHSPDFAKPVDWAALLEGVDNIVHLAGLAHMPPGSGNAEMYERINVAPTIELVRAASRRGVRQFVFLSSLGAQTGPAADHVLTELDQPRPTEHYGRSKLLAETALRESDLPYTILRPAVVYGPGVKGTLARLTRIAAMPWPLPLKALVNRRSLLGLDNLIEAIKFVLASPTGERQTYLVADPEALSLAEIVSTLRIAAGRRPHLFAVPPSLLKAGLRLAGRGDEWSRLAAPLVVDPGKLMTAGWNPVIDTRTGLARMVQAA